MKIQGPAVSIVSRAANLRAAMSAATEASANRFTAVPIASEIALRQQSDAQEADSHWDELCLS